MIDKSETSPSIKSLVDTALESMPNFSEDLQTNNVLTRRILAMKVEKGFAANKDEAIKNMKTNMNQFQTQVSTQLTNNVKSDDISQPKQIHF